MIEPNLTDDQNRNANEARPYKSPTLRKSLEQVRPAREETVKLQDKSRELESEEKR